MGYCISQRSRLSTLAIPPLELYTLMANLESLDHQLTRHPIFWCSEVDICSFTVLGLEFQKSTKCNFNEYLVWFGSSGCVKEIIGFGLLNILIKYVDDSLSVSNWSCTTKYLRHVFLSIVSYLLMYVILIVLMENWFYEPP